MTPEFSRPERLDSIGGEERRVTITADADERVALARRFGLLSVDRLEGDFAIRRTAAGVTATGRVRAEVVQACSVTGDPLPVTVEEPVALRFVESMGAHGGAAQDEEIELGADAVDEVELTGGQVDLGEAAAETMALTLDPFPRGPGAEAALRAAGVVSEEEAGPFGGLAALRDRLKDGAKE